MKNIVEIKNVRCDATDEVGTMYLIASVDEEAKTLDKVEHLGLSVFFKPLDEKVEYIKSFIFTDQEMRLFRRGSATIMRDIGYILDVQNTTLSIIQLTGCSQPTKEYSPWSSERVLRSIFTIEHNHKGLDLLNAEYDTTRHGKSGFRLAISQCFKDMLNITDDSIVPTTFPKEANVVEYNYLVE